MSISITRLEYERLLSVFRSMSQQWICSRPFVQEMEPATDISAQFRTQDLSKVTWNTEVDSSISEMQSVLNIAALWGVKSGSALDFGCGIGRLFRRLPRKFRIGSVGVDIDGSSIETARSAIGSEGFFVQIQHDSSLPFEDDLFAFCYSCSVFTHMSLESQVFWLRELTRVTKGPVIISVHGPTFLADCKTWINCPDGLFGIIRSGHHCVDGVNQELLKHVDPAIYKDTSHMPYFVIDFWSKYVTVDAVIPGGFGGSHDAVVVREKK